MTYPYHNPDVRELERLSLQIRQAAEASNAKMDKAVNQRIIDVLKVPGKDYLNNANNAKLLYPEGWIEEVKSPGDVIVVPPSRRNPNSYADYADQYIVRLYNPDNKKLETNTSGKTLSIARCLAAVYARQFMLMES